ncbi:hypothetical protein EVAR_25565_1 [Eumeta japonica]|uniref:Uncharacterized protein n=1 Tax=Eumeta variegata TaxID=151549 RepID=A0A4C1Z2F3_EUMVA|nr:hypothetical protein EVAR_25565_1 [Eumeta japonica]
MEGFTPSYITQLLLHQFPSIRCANSIQEAGIASATPMGLQEYMDDDQRRCQYNCGWVTEAMQVDDVIASISRMERIDIDYVQTPIIKNTFNKSYCTFRSPLDPHYEAVKRGGRSRDLRRAPSLEGQSSSVRAVSGSQHIKRSPDRKKEIHLYPLGLCCRSVLGIYLWGKRACKPAKSKLSSPPMDTRNPRGDTSALPSS